MKYKRDEINELLVDYLEGDLSEGLKNDLNLVVKNSPIREKSLRALTETRKIVQSAEPKMPELSDTFFNQLHDKVMADVSKTTPHKRVRLWLSEQSWRTYAAVAVMVLVSGSVFLSYFKPTVSLQSAGLERQSDMLLSISVEVPEAFADSLLNHTSADDFFMNTVAEKVAQLEEGNVSDLMNELSE